MRQLNTLLSLYYPSIDNGLIDSIQDYLHNAYPNLEQYQVDALISLIYDIGINAFMDSNIPQYLHSKHYILVGNAFMYFNKNGRVVSVTKAARRKQEQNLFLNGAINGTTTILNRTATRT